MYIYGYKYGIYIWIQLYIYMCATSVSVECCPLGRRGSGLVGALRLPLPLLGFPSESAGPWGDVDEGFLTKGPLGQHDIFTVMGGFKT